MQKQLCKLKKITGEKGVFIQIIGTVWKGNYTDSMDPSILQRIIQNANVTAVTLARYFRVSVAETKITWPTSTTWRPLKMKINWNLW